MGRAKKVIFDLEQFKYLDELKLSFPQLVLGIHIPTHKFDSDFPPQDYKFKAGRQWHKIAHQTSGLGRKPFYLIGTILSPRDEGAISDVESVFKYTNVGMTSVELYTLNKYAKELDDNLKVGCNESYHFLAEGLYPIDLVFLPKMAKDSIDVSKLDDFVIWDSGMQRATSSINRWSLYILGKNSS